MKWTFWVDVGGTFTDVVARDPDGKVRTRKVLSSGVVQGRTTAGCSRGTLVDNALAAKNEASVCDGLFNGYRVILTNPNGEEVLRTITRFEAAKGIARLDAPVPDFDADWSYAITADEPAPVLAMRLLMQKGLRDAIGPVELRLGTTLGTNALLQRRGARTAYITTAGFGDVPEIGTQDRPDLFALDITKPQLLHERVIEINERIAADGTVLKSIDRLEVANLLAEARAAGIESLAICLLNSYANSEHERVIADIARKTGFKHVSISADVSPTIRIVQRADTTIVDAYLTPVLNRYIARIESICPGASLRLMTSNGGLVSAASFSGASSVLSGPAGGVVGLARAADEADAPEVIGFDMGGTSTDVSRYAGRFVYQHETKKAGVRIATPMLLIETVAAGGGSICAFDGFRLTVGPQSAGAQPGPACYGRGGPLTVTDLNVLLGRIPRNALPFALDFKAAQQRLDELTHQVNAAGHDKLDAAAVAEGLLRIAIANMAAPIAQISTREGYDARNHAMVAFGGAAPQHAVAVAESIGIGRVIIHRRAAVLSAYGIGHAPMKRMHERTLLTACEPGAFKAVVEAVRELSKAAGESLASEGVAAELHDEARVMLQVRYVGQSATITLDNNDLGSPHELNASNVAQAFANEYQRRFGHRHADRSCEVVNVAVEISETTRTLAEAAANTEAADAATSLKAVGTTTVVFDGQQIQTPMYARENVPAEVPIDGPALIVEPDSTTVVEPGWRAIRKQDGRLELLRDGQHQRERSASTSVDPVDLELFHRRFAGIAALMGAQLQRTALSTNVKERLDYSCAVFDADGELVANAPHIPVHLGAMGHCVKAVASTTADMQPGDVIVTNDPFAGGSHLPDVTVITPVFDDNSVLRYFVASRAHHAEIGGTRPGSVPPDATCLADEGMLIRPTKLIASGVSREDGLRDILTSGQYPSRDPEMNLADLRAQVAANHAGLRELLALSESLGFDVVAAYMKHIREASAAKMLRALRAFGNGRYTANDALDDGSTIAVAIEIDDNGASFDFAGTADVNPGNLNATPAIVSSAVLYCLRCLLNEDVPLNGGVLQHVKIDLPCCMLNPQTTGDPSRDPAVVGGNVETSQRVVDVIFRALGVVAASQGTMNNLLFGDETFGYYETIGGGAGAGPTFNGASAVHTHMTNTRLTDVETLEARYPVRVRAFGIRKNSGGAGEHAGGDGIVREIEFLKRLDVSLLTSRRTSHPYGQCGGQPGKAGVNEISRSGQPFSQLPWRTMIEVNPGDILKVSTPGGGGFGKNQH